MPKPPPRINMTPIPELQGIASIAAPAAPIEEAPAATSDAPDWPYADRPQFDESEVKIFRGRQWVPLELAESKLQFWQERDWQHGWQAPASPDFQHGVIHTDGSRSGGQPVETNAVSDAEAVERLVEREPHGKTDWFEGDVDADGNELITVRLDDWNRAVRERDKFMWQVRDTCTRAEKAEAALATLQPPSGLRDALVSTATNAAAADAEGVRTCPDCTGAGNDGHGHTCYLCDGQGGVIPYRPTPASSALREALEHEFCGWQVDDPREAADRILAIITSSPNTKEQGS